MKSLLLSISQRMRFLIVLTPLFVITSSYAQEPVPIKGSVRSQENGEPIVGASVIVEGTTKGTTTGMNGTFEIKAASNATLTFSFMGYVSQTVKISGESTINVILAPDTKEINDVVVIGYGVVKKRDLTGAVGSVNPSEMVGTAAAGVTSALAGRVAGLQVVNTSGGPDDGENFIRIRGGNSITGSNDPLWVIDGFITAGGASMVPMEDIQSVEVLKDASATAIYGARGANGVILVTTKRGNFNSVAPTVTFRNHVGVEWMVRDVPLMNRAQQYDFLKAKGTAVDSRIDSSTNFDWVDAITRNALKQSYYASVSGGSNVMTYNVSAEYQANEGVLNFNSDSKRYNIRGVFDFRLNKHIKMGFTARYLQQDKNRLANGDVYQRALELNPLTPAFGEDGSYNYHLNVSNLDDDLGSALYQGNNRVVYGNLIEYLRSAKREQTAGTLNMQAYIDIKFLKHFTWRSEVSFNKVNTWDQYYSPSNIDLQTPAELTHTQDTAYESINTLTYLNTIGDHSINAMIGHTVQSEVSRNLLGGNRFFPTDEFEWNNLGAGIPTELSHMMVGSDYIKTTILSFIARINYIYKDRYLFTVSGRADGASKFAEKKKWAYFPSGAFSWRASEEPFIKNWNVFDNLKFRASIGVTGSEAITPYQSLGLMSDGTLGNISSPEPPYYTLSTIYRAKKMRNEDLTWETTTQYDFGIDMGFFGNRLRATIDYYNKDTKKLLLEAPPALETGYDVTMMNVGKINNHGVEVSLSGRVVKSKNFNWDSDFNIAFNRNKVKSLSVGLNKMEIQSVTNPAQTVYLEVGQPVGIFYGYKTNGIWQSQEEIDANPHREGVRPGDLRYVKTTTDGNGIDSRDKVIIGDPNPKFTFGFTNNFRYRNFDLILFFTGSYGNDVLNYAAYELEVHAGNRLARCANYWTPENRSQTQMWPNALIAAMPDRYVEDGSYIKLQSATLRYNFGERILRKLHLKGLSIYVTGTNLWMLTDYSGINPEGNALSDSNIVRGIDYTTYPLSASVIGGISLTF